MAVSYKLPYDPTTVVDRITWKITEFAMLEDWIGQLVFNKLQRLGRINNSEDKEFMRRFLHVSNVFETELRMRYKDRGYYGL
jgi:hypothetical protein